MLDVYSVFIMNDRSHLLSEQRLPESMTLDTMSIEQGVELMNQQDARAVQAVAAEKKNIARAVELIVAALRANGRLFYVGAGTSGRLGVLDAAECPPTFRTDPATVQGIIAGGDAAMFRAQEGVEDRADDGAAAMDQSQIGTNDIVVGIAAGGTTPFVHGALRRAKILGAKTVFLSCVQPVPNEPQVDVVIRPQVGPEVVTGSTRLKAGTATKLILNTLSTLAMVQLGKTYENLMVDLRATNQKLWDRGTRIISTLTGLPRAQALTLLQQADGHVKLAIVMHTRNLPPQQAKQELEKHNQRLREAMKE
jgi:N-acetylmuramic acid 6-phosphate etherase